MCGIAGILDPEGVISDLRGATERMAASLRHRGPDDAGTWISESMRATLCHTRLAIRGLGPCGHQPMASASARWVIAYNGEIYNTSELRAALPRSVVEGLRGTSDTELLVECIDHLGVTETLRRIAGMFAFAAVEPANRRLVLARDRLGIKPLAFAEFKGAICFGSDTRIFPSIPGFKAAVDDVALDGFLRTGWVRGQASILRGVRRLPPGTWIEFVDGRAGSSTPRPYWHLTSAWELARKSPLDGTDGAIEEEVEALLLPVVRDHLASDVPLGSFLSGGIDSSLVTALAAEASGRRIRTFTIGFDRVDFDESRHAEAVARQLGTEHSTMVVGEADALAAIPLLGEAFDEPFGDSSALPTLLLSRMTRSSVTVALSGDGGDELFAGYSRHQWIPRIHARAAGIPAWGRRAAAAAVDAAAGSASALSRLLPVHLRPRQLSDKARKAAGLLRSRASDDLYRATVECWDPRQRLVEGVAHGHALRPHAVGPCGLRDVMMADLGSYLPDDILVKTDRASMFASLEVRVPFLDHRLLELSMRLPERSLVRNGRGKWILRRILAKRVPDRLFDRPKSGFTVPLASWLRGSLRAWAEDHLTSQALSTAGLIPSTFLKEWSRLLAGSDASAPRVWNAIHHVGWHRRVIGAHENPP